MENKLQYLLTENLNLKKLKLPPTKNLYYGW